MHRMTVKDKRNSCHSVSPSNKLSQKSTVAKIIAGRTSEGTRVTAQFRHQLKHVLSKRESNL
jgi:hypothetical protein